MRWWPIWWHRDVVVRDVGPAGRTVIRSSIVDVAIDDTGAIEVEVAAEIGYLFPVSVTFLDEDDAVGVGVMAADPQVREPGAGLEVALVALGVAVLGGGLVTWLGARLAVALAGDGGVVAGGMSDWLPVATRLARGRPPAEAWGDAGDRAARPLRCIGRAPPWSGWRRWRWAPVWCGCGAGSPARVEWSGAGSGSGPRPGRPAPTRCTRWRCRR